MMKRKSIDKCRNLRKNQTEAEKKLWLKLRGRQLDGVKFRRQFSVGQYVIDFYCPKYQLGIEVDGGQHYDTKSMQQDAFRTKKLSEAEVRIIRFSNLDVLNNIDGVCQEILKALTPSS